MSSMSQNLSHPALYQQDLVGLIHDIVYARTLIAAAGGDVREQDEPLRLALRDALSRLDRSDEERQRILEAARDAAWARLAAELGFDSNSGVDGSVANAA